MNLIKKIESKSAVIGVVGLGYVGIPLASRYCSEGFTVIGFDIDERKLKSLQSYGKTLAGMDTSALKPDFFQATDDFSMISKVDAIIICVPTPLTKNRDPDLSAITSALSAVAPFLREDQVISLESTTYPGTTEELVASVVNCSGFEIGSNFYVVYSPEREDPGRLDFTTKNTPKVCGGMTANCLEVGKSLYQAVIDNVVTVSSTKVAEMTKLLENIHRAVNISLVNEMKIVADRMDIDIFEVIEAAGTKPFGFVKYKPGPGIGGHCIPVDPYYLTWKAREFGLHTRFIELAGEINNFMPEYVVNKLSFALNSREVSMKGSSVCVLGVAYKKNIGDLRESPALDIIRKLISYGVKVSFHDSFVPKLVLDDILLESCELCLDSIRDYDAFLIVTDHDNVDYELIQSRAKLIIDTRGILSLKSENVVRA